MAHQVLCTNVISRAARPLLSNGFTVSITIASVNLRQNWRRLVASDTGISSAFMASHSLLMETCSSMITWKMVPCGTFFMVRISELLFVFFPSFHSFTDSSLNISVVILACFQVHQRR